MANKREKGRPSPGDRSRKNRLEADLLELKLRREKGELFDALEVQRAWEDLAIRLRVAIDALEVSLKEKARIKSELRLQFDGTAKFVEDSRKAA